MDIDNLQNTLNTLFDRFDFEISENDARFVERMFQGGIDKYIDRLKALDFQSKTSVLDAGCGFGQWSLALSQLNENISCCDVSKMRLDFLENLATQLGVNNLETQQCSIHKLPYADNSFDAIFCYSVIQNTPWKTSLAELARVLQPDGVMYLNANGLGWYLNLWQNEVNKTVDYDPKSVAAQAFADTLQYLRNGVFDDGASLIIEPHEIKELFNQLGFAEVHIGNEGTLTFSETGDVSPMLTGDYHGFTAVFEFVAKK